MVCSLLQNCQLPDTLLGSVKEYRHTTAPVDMKLQGTQGGGISFFCGPKAGVESKIEVGAAASSRIFNVNCATPKHWTPSTIRKTPSARNKDRHMVRPPVNNNIAKAVYFDRLCLNFSANFDILKKENDEYKCPRYQFFRMKACRTLQRYRL